jgi:hypothetical protein
LTLFSRKDWYALKGLLVIAPNIPDKHESNVNITLREAAFDVYSDVIRRITGKSMNSTSLSPFAIYTFDSTWALIQTLSKIRDDQPLPSLTNASRCFDRTLINGMYYEHYLNNINFNGISGHVRFMKNVSNDRVDGILYALYNAQWVHENHLHTGDSLHFTQPMIWRQLKRTWENTSNSTEVSIIWPGVRNEGVPSDSQKLRGKNEQMCLLINWICINDRR